MINYYYFFTSELSSSKNDRNIRNDVTCEVTLVEWHAARSSGVLFASWSSWVTNIKNDWFSWWWWHNWSSRSEWRNRGWWGSGWRSWWRYMLEREKGKQKKEKREGKWIEKTYVQWLGSQQWRKHLCKGLKE